MSRLTLSIFLSLFSFNIYATGKPALCIFDYDMTLSSHKCDKTYNNPDYFCRKYVKASTYDWFPQEQCLAIAGQQAIQKCVEEGAYIGISSHAERDLNWEDKVVPIVTENQFPALTNSPNYNQPGNQYSYPKIDDKKSWNCDNCAYHMQSGDKPERIRSIMKHYGLDPNSIEDQARVIFWDDSLWNISQVNGMGKINTVYVPRNDTVNNNPNLGGCGIDEKLIQKGWDEFYKNN